MSRNYERSPAIDLPQPIFRITNCSLFLPMNSHLIARVLSPKNLTIFSFFFYRKGDQYEFFKNEEIHFRIFVNATKSNKTNVFEVSCLQVYERFRDTQSIDFAPLHHRSPISVRRKPKIHCHCFLFFFFFLSCWLFNLPWLGTSTMIPQNMIYVVPLHKNEFLFRRIENCSRFQLITVLSV